MANARKRPRSEPEVNNGAECPFSISYNTGEDKDKKNKRRRPVPEEEEKQKVFYQISPFTPSGKFKTHETMDLHYKVEPYKAWQEMTRYNSFVRKAYSEVPATCRLPADTWRAQ
jgi:hypothetical protein